MAEIKFEELQEGVKAKCFTLIDLRKPEELAETGKLPGAHCLPVQELEEALSLDGEAFRHKYGFTKPAASGDAKPLVWYCRSGRRVGVAQETLARLGYTGHRLYFGSFQDWSSNGGPVDKCC
ncbi:rhodanese domain-containing protein CG4456 [Hyalella azteca]|uniref:Rhodanese domain-containing protein CG4456 n=1 Tax=Hyalella azteca TaxID=294128 RepID=A0A8B7PJE9_HYAAZ|nr:rhodanese domain-containing protein CG4456 [Hyalella azteca]